MADLASLEWHYVLNGEQVGPVPTTVLAGMLRNGMLSGTTRVWCEELPEWVAVERIEEFEDDVRAGEACSAPEASFPPPLPVAEQHIPTGAFKDSSILSMWVGVACSVMVVINIIRLGGVFTPAALARFGGSLAMLAACLELQKYAFFALAIIGLLLWLLLFPLWVYRSQKNNEALGATGFAFSSVGAALLSLPVLILFAGPIVISEIFAAARETDGDAWKKYRRYETVPKAWWRCLLLSIVLSCVFLLMPYLLTAQPTAGECIVLLCLSTVRDITQMFFLAVTGIMVRAVARLQTAAADR